MSQAEKEIILEAQNIHYAYEEDGSHSLDGVSLQIKKGSKVAFMGANGCGKSTFFLCCNGILRPKTGRILVQGKPIEYTKKGLSQLRRQVGIVFQDPDNQLFAASVFQEISFGILNLGVSNQEAKEAVEEVIEELEITPFRDRPAHALSGGQKKQVTIADILVMHPDILILDEPTSSLDAKHTQIVNEIVERLAAEGITILMSTHNMDYALSWADEIILMENGKILIQDHPSVVCKDKEALAKTNQTEPVVLRLFEKLKKKGVFKEEQKPPISIEELELYIEESERSS